MLTEIQIAVISGLMSMLGWGLADFFTKKTVDKIDSLRTLFWSQLFAMITIPIYLLLNFQLPTFTFQTILYTLILSFFSTFGILLFFRGLSKGKAGVISPVYSSYAAFAVLTSFFIFHEVIIGLTWLGLGIIFLGLILASFDYKELKKIDFELRDLSKGIPETLLAAILMGLYFPFWDRFLTNEGWPFFLLLSGVFSSLILFIISFFRKSDLKIKDKKLWKWLFLIGIFNWGGFIFLIWGFELTRFTSIITLLSATSPVVVITLARIFLKEKLSLTQKLGIGLLFVGLIIISI